MNGYLQTHKPAKSYTYDNHSRPEGKNAASVFTDNRPQTVAQRRLQAAANNSSQVKQLKHSHGFANDGTRVIQRENKITMHSLPYDTRLAGAGAGSDHDTEAEVVKTIKANNIQDLRDTYTALHTSVTVRGSTPRDSGHETRYKLEVGWLKLLGDAIRVHDAIERQKSFAGVPFTMGWGARPAVLSTTSAPAKAAVPATTGVSA